MSKLTKRVAMAAWILVGTLFSSHFWISNPQYFPEFPKPLAYWLVDLYGAQNQEEVADVEALTGLVFGLVFTALVTWLALAVWRRLRHAKPSE